MADSASCTPSKHVVPILQGKFSAKVTPPWFVDCSEYTPKMASFKALVNGKQAFGDVYRAIEAAQKSVCIICWGFQPSMYFIRRPGRLMIGELLEKKAREGVMVRLLCWGLTKYAGINAVAALGEGNTPGRWQGWGRDKGDLGGGDTSTEAQYEYDKNWYLNFDRRQSLWETSVRLRQSSKDAPRDKLLFTSRAYSAEDQLKLTQLQYQDKGLSGLTRATLAGAPSHHQKSVIVDHEDPQAAVGFVMGHNMLDAYWDDSDHGWQAKTAATGRNGNMPLHDYSSKVTGPIVGDLFLNFRSAWELETDQSLPVPAFKTYPVHGHDDKAACQILRTQPQHGREDIMKCYLQATVNATQYIHIENQYFRWPPLAETIKAHAAKMSKSKRLPEKHGSLYLFVITNTSDDGIGSGTVNTYRMLDSLGRADRLPEVARDQRLADVDALRTANEAQMAQVRGRRLALDSQPPAQQGASGAAARAGQYAALDEQASRLKARQRELDEASARLEPKSIRERLAGSDRTPEAIKAANLPGLKVHVATLVAPDTPAGQEWQEVYIHAKLMLIDDTFMTLGSANINTRSMQTDSEMNIAHHRPEITRPLREEQWARYTNGATAGLALPAVFNAWQDIMKENADAKRWSRRPIAQLAEFLRTSDKISNLD